MADRLGQQLGNYKLIRLLGRGGFAEVYLGEHTRLGTQAAIKVLSTQLATEDVAIFQQEARTVARLEHPHIVRVLDFDVHEGTPFLVMQLAANGTLRTRHPRGTRLSMETIVPYVRQVADALHYAHEERLIHRDVKPENMLLGRRNEVLLSDFGLATFAQSSRYQSSQEVAGTVAYMAPEQVQGKPRPASDQYSLGIVVYEWLTGDRPFHGSFTEIATQHVLTPPPPLREKLPDLAPAVEQAVMIALAKDPKERFGSVLAFASAMEQSQRASGALNQAPTQTFRPSTPLPDPATAAPPANVPRVTTQLPTIHPPTRALQVGAFKGIKLLTYRGHQERVGGLAWSPNGARIASAGYDGTVHVWSAETGALLSSRTAHPHTARAVSWSPDGRYVVSGGLEQVVQVWDAATELVVVTYRNHTKPVNAVAWTPTGQWIASASTDGMVEIWDALTGASRFISNKLSASAYAVAWSPDGQRLATGSGDKTVRVWSAFWMSNYRYSGHSGTVRAVAWAPDGRRIASASEDKTVQVWDAATGQLLVSYAGSAAWVDSIAWSPDGRYIVSAGADGSAQVWNAANGHHLFSYRGHEQPVTAVAWAPNSYKIASASKDKTVQVWSLE